MGRLTAASVNQRVDPTIAWKRVSVWSDTMTETENEAASIKTDVEKIWVLYEDALKMAKEAQQKEHDAVAKANQARDDEYESKGKTKFQWERYMKAGKGSRKKAMDAALFHELEEKLYQERYERWTAEASWHRKECRRYSIEADRYKEQAISIKDGGTNVHIGDNITQIKDSAMSRSQVNK